jgi:hypothetical protein
MSDLPLSMEKIHERIENLSDIEKELFYCCLTAVDDFLEDEDECVINLMGLRIGILMAAKFAFDIQRIDGMPKMGSINEIINETIIELQKNMREIIDMGSHPSCHAYLGSH